MEKGASFLSLLTRRLRPSRRSFRTRRSSDFGVLGAAWSHRNSIQCDPRSTRRDGVRPERPLGDERKISHCAGLAEEFPTRFLLVCRAGALKPWTGFCSVEGPEIPFSK